MGQKSSINSKNKQDFAEIAKLDTKPSASSSISSKIIEEVDTNDQHTDK